jgi:hypothetical protein
LALAILSSGFLVGDQQQVGMRGFGVLAEGYKAEMIMRFMCMSRWDYVDYFDTNK